jgi:glycosyltransferase involved in cell wall biosynthesis
MAHKSDQHRVVAILYNTAHYIILFRKNLVLRLIERGYQVVAITPVDDYVEQVEDLGVKHIPITLDKKGKRPLNDFIYFSNILRILRELHPHIVLGFTIKPNIYGSLACSVLGIPFIPNITGLGTVFLQGGAAWTLTQFLYKLSFRTLRLIFFQNQSDRDEFLERRLCKMGQTEVLKGSGIDLNQFYPVSEKTNSSNPRTIFLFIGRLLKEKGVREFVQAAAMVKADYPYVKFQLLGPGDQSNPHAIRIDEVRQWENEGLIEYIEPVKDVRPYIHQSTALVLPSYREGLSRTLLEAAACGKPLLAADVPGCREVVHQGINGFLFNPRDPIDLSQKIIQFLSLSFDDVIKFGLESRRLATKEFDEEIVIRSYLRAVNQTEIASRIKNES